MNKCGCQAWWLGRCHTPGTSICSANARVIRRRDDGLFQRDCRSAAAIKRMTAFSPGLGVYRVARAAIEVTYWRVVFFFSLSLTPDSQGLCSPPRRGGQGWFLRWQRTDLKPLDAKKKATFIFLFFLAWERKFKCAWKPRRSAGITVFFKRYLVAYSSNARPPARKGSGTVRHCVGRREHASHAAQRFSFF